VSTTLNLKIAKYLAGLKKELNQSKSLTKKQVSKALINVPLSTLIIYSTMMGEAIYLLVS